MATDSGVYRICTSLSSVFVFTSQTEIENCGIMTAYNLRKTMKTQHKRIDINPNILVGKPVIRGTRIPVYLIVNLVAQGKTAKMILDDYPDLTPADIQAALEFAADSTNFTEETLSPSP